MKMRHLVFRHDGVHYPSDLWETGMRNVSASILMRWVLLVLGASSHALALEGTDSTKRSSVQSKGNPAGATEQPHTAAVVAGALGTVVYAGTIIGDLNVNGEIDFPELFLPVLGAPIALIRYDDVVINQAYSGRSTEKLLLGISGALQARCVVVVIVDLTPKESSPGPPASAMRISPFGGPGEVGLTLTAPLF